MSNEELINKQDTIIVNDISFITDNVIDYTDETILDKFTKPSGDAIIPNFDNN